MAEGSGNNQLRVLLEEAGLSNAGLARAVVTAGAEEGVHLGTNATSVKRILNGCQPRWPVPRLVAKVLSRRLGFAVSVQECGFVDRGEPTDTFDAFQRAPSIDGTIGLVAELSGRDMRRRNFLLGATFATAAFAEPAWLAMTMPAESAAARTAGARVGANDVAVITDTVRHFERLHRRYGGGIVRDQVVSYVHQQADLVLQSTYTERVGGDLLRAVTQATWLAGLTSVDSGRPALGQAYYAQALNLAQQSGDKLYAANILAEMSNTTMDVGNATGDAGPHGQHAVALARSAVQVAGRSATPAFGAWLHAMEARGLAMLGDRAGVEAAVSDAQRSYERADGDEPEWFGFYGEPDLLGDVGQCLRDAGRPRQGLALLERAAAALPVDRVTSRVKTQIHIAAAQVELGEFEAAGRTADQALAAGRAVSSNRIVGRVRTLRHRARGHQARRGSQDLDERLGAFLSGQSA